MRWGFTMKWLLAVLLLFAAVGFGENLLVLPFQETNSDGLAPTVQSLFKTALTSEGFDVKLGDAVCTDLTCAVQEGKTEGTDLVLYGSLNRLGHKIIVAVFLVDVQTRQQVHSDELAALYEDDLDVVVKRLAVGIKKRKAASATATKDLVTEKETIEPRRRKSYYTVGGRIGYMFPFGGYGDDSRLFCYEGIGLYEMEHYIVEAKAGLHLGEHSAEVPIDFSLLYTPYLGDFSPYIAGGLGVHLITISTRVDSGEYYHYEDNEGDGFALNVGGGLMAFQTYDFRLNLDVRYTIAFPNHGLGTHHGVAITLGITRRYSPNEKSSAHIGCCLGGSIQ